MKKNKYTTWSYWRDEWVKPIIIAIIMALFIRTFIVQPFKIPSSSMYPTLKIKDRIFVNKYIYGAKLPFTNIRLPRVRAPRIGDIVVFKSPTEPDKFLIKRFIAGPGQTIEIVNGRLLINNKAVSVENLDGKYVNIGKYGKEGVPVKVPDGTFYVLGDNSNNSVDSRYWGFVPYKNLVGKAFFIHWPVTRIRLLK
jgi:signal peptidase I